MRDAVEADSEESLKRADVASGQPLQAVYGGGGGAAAHACLRGLAPEAEQATEEDDREDDFD